MNFLFPKYLNIIAFAIVVGQKPPPSTRDSTISMYASPFHRQSVGYHRITKQFLLVKLRYLHAKKHRNSQDASFPMYLAHHKTSWVSRKHRNPQDASFPMYLAMQCTYLVDKNTSDFTRCKFSDVFGSTKRFLSIQKTSETPKYQDFRCFLFV